MSKQQMTLSQLKQFIEHTKTKKVVFALINQDECHLFKLKIFRKNVKIRAKFR